MESPSDQPDVVKAAPENMIDPDVCENPVPKKKRVTTRMQCEGLGFLLASMKDNAPDYITNPEEETENPESGDEETGIEKQTVSPIESNEKPEIEQPSVNENTKCYEYIHKRLYDLWKPKECIVTIEAPFANEQHKSSNNFVKGCKWSPDGTSLLTNSDDRKCRVFTFPNILYDCYKGETFDDQKGMALKFDDSQVKTLQTHHFGELIYDFVWYPQMTSNNPDSCLYSCTGRDHPVHMINICDGKLVAVYGATNHLDLLQSCHSLCFSHDGNKLIGGLNKSIRVFDVHRPGIQTNSTIVNTTVHGSGGLNGIVSCLKMSPQHHTVYAAATYAKSVGFFDLNYPGPQCVFEYEGGGITNLWFSPDANKLIAGSRKDSSLTCWDVRNPGKILFNLQRNVTSNQRIYFDSDFYGNYLFSGSNDGEISVWDLINPPDQSNNNSDEIGGPNLVHKWKANNTTVAGISVNPNLPILATSSGQRLFSTPMFDSDDSDSNDKNEIIENNVKLWWIGKNLQQ